MDLKLTDLLVYIFPAVTLAGILYYFRLYAVATARPETLLDLMGERPRFVFPRVTPLSRRDVAPILVLTLLYGVVAFIGLGSTGSPQSFFRFEKAVSSATIDLGNPQSVGKIIYYTGSGHGDNGYRFETSTDGLVWVQQENLEQSYSKTFHWMDHAYEQPLEDVRYLRLTATRLPMELGELALALPDGTRIPSDDFTGSEGTDRLFDEPERIPERATYLNSTYFDEIYHARTAYEYLNGLTAYENTHPPLGKILISLGIVFFGMTPFGWRFVGTLFGVLMVPLFYVWIKNLFGKTRLAILGTLLFSFDFMHYTQTRIATIDTYGVFFTILMYWFMYRFISTDFQDKAHKQLIPLALCGLSFGLGIASKWTAFYAATGLVLLYFFYLVLQGKALFGLGEKKRYFQRLGLILLVSVLFFVVAAGAIYYFSYIPYAAGMQKPLSWSVVWQNQTGMFNYHKGVDATHSYASRWWMWLVNARPILYYLEYLDGGLRSSFGAFLNPVVCWAGLIALGFLAVRFVKRRNDPIALYILIGYLAQLLPWIPITRITFAYHYFPSMIFLVLALTKTFDDWAVRAPGSRRPMILLTAGSVGLFFLFYPVLSGLTIPAQFGERVLGWFPSWPF